MILRALALVVAASVLAPPVTRAQSVGDTIAIVEPFGPGSPSELAIRVLKPALERELKARLLIEHIGSANGDAALARVASGQPNGRMLLAITDATRIFHEYQANTPRKLEQLKPVAKLTEGISMALAMPHGSPIDTWEKFVARSKANPMPVVGLGPRSPSALFQTMIERQVQVKFQSSRYDLDIEVLAAMARDDEPGIIPSSSALSQPALGRPAPVVLLTSGARRHPDLPNVPTLAEIAGNQRLAFTISVGLFGPPGMDSATAAALARAVAAAGKDEAVRAAARKLSLPLAVNDSAVLMETMKRTRRVIQELVHR